MDIALFDYHLPPELIAQFPARRRDQSRLLVLNRATGERGIAPFKSFVGYVNKGDALVVNTTKVFKARLLGHRTTGAKIEVFLVRRLRTDGMSAVDVPASGAGSSLWEALVRPSRRVKEGESISFDRHAAILRRDLGDGKWAVEFGSQYQEERIIAANGHVPLPPYIKRGDQPTDIRRYQTFFADKARLGAVAAPTAGFHFTRSILNVLSRKGVKIVRVCLHVGPGTFKPVTAESIEDHTVDPEHAELSPDAASVLNRVRQSGGRIFAVGTTSVRTLESAPVADGLIQPFVGDVDLYIRPGFQFGVVDHLITNFHLPKSSLLILVSAFAGREVILEAYREAIANRLRFFSYGDAMLIL
jgi:S-adenosylmethionine:tRNA ribosyltransferase-isomerase